MIAKLKSHKPDVGVLACLGLMVVAFFWKVIFLAQPISKVFILGKRDVLFRKYFTLGQCGFDESVYLLLAPYYRLIADYWRHFQAPLWNPYCGWGLPLLGDIQAAVFSPFRILFALNPTMYQFNLLIVLEVFAAVAGTYVLARHLRISKTFSVLAALSYGFCPYFLYFIELLSGTTSALLPWIFWLFVRLSTKPSRKRVVACAIGCAVFIASGHPESSFIGVSFATLNMLLLFAFKKQLAEGLRWTAAVAGLAVCFAAPVILPFLEYLRYSDCYKFRHANTALTPVSGLLLNLLQPLYWGASPYLGFLSVATVPLSLFVKDEKKSCVLVFVITSFIGFICICRPLFFGPLFDMTPAGLVPGIYCAPAFLVQMSILSAIGCGYLVEKLQFGKNRAFFVFIIALLIACFVPAALNLAGFPFKSGNFDNGVADMAFNSKNWLYLMVMSLVAFLLLAFKKKLPATVLSIVLVGMSFGSQCLASKSSLPNQPVLHYDQFEPLPFLEKERKRVMALGFDVLAPNTNIAYQIASVGTHNVMMPTGYIDFMVAGGANWTTFNTVFDRVPIKNMLDYCGIKYVVALVPVFGERDPVPSMRALPLAVSPQFKEAPSLKLSEAKVVYDSGKAEVRGRLKFSLPESALKQYHYSIVICDESGNPFWYGGLSAMRAIGRNNWGLTDDEKRGYVNFSALVPITMKPGQKFNIGLQVFDSKLVKFLEVIPAPGLKTFGPVISLCEETFAAPDLGSKDLHYSLLSESGPQKIRVYENTLSLGRAYMVFSAIAARSQKEALEKFADKNFNGFSTVIVENGSGTVLPAQDSKTRPGISVPIISENPNRVEMNVDAPADGYLVLTDTFFPGWKATVDDRSVEIMRANFLFRAVRVSAGSHKVVFSYEPLSITVAAALFVAGLLASLFILCKRRQVGQTDL